MNINIKWGDTLSGLASKFGTSVGALMHSNPQIQDKNLILAGHSLNVPGSKGGSDGFDGSSSSSGSPDLTGGRTGFADSGPGSSGPNGSPFDIAMGKLNVNASTLKVGGDALGRAMQDWVPNNINCANFVSGCLVASGQIPQSEQSAGVYDLMGKLDRDSNFKRVSLANAKPGDVVSFDTGGGEHVVMFAGFKNGVPQFIGSNNVNSDGSQRVTMGPMNYSIMAIHHYVG